MRHVSVRLRLRISDVLKRGRQAWAGRRGQAKQRLRISGVLKRGRQAWAGRRGQAKQRLGKSGVLIDEDKARLCELLLSSP